MFCAVDLPEVIRTRIEKHTDRVRNAVPESQPSWTRVNNIHLTLKFFGNVEHARVNRITDALSGAIENVSQFKVSIGGAGAFPNNRQPRVLWIGIDDRTDELAQLQKRLEDECAREGFPKEDRAFRPHLTIARIRNSHNANHLAEAHLKLEFASVEVSLSELVLFRSELSPKGSKYTPISLARLES